MSRFRRNWFFQSQQRPIRRPSRLRLERIEDRITPAQIAWDGGAGTFTWGTAQNWVGDVLPGTNDEAIIGPAFSAITVASGGTVSIDKLTSSATVNIAGGSMTLAAPSSSFGLKITGTLTANAATAITSLNMSGGTLTGTGTVTVSNSLTWTGGSMNGTGKTVLAASASSSINYTGQSYSIGRTLENAGQLTYNGTQGVRLTYSTEVATIQNLAGATFTSVGEGDISGLGLSDNPNAFTNAGTFIRTGTGETFFNNGVGFTNTGSVVVQQGKFTLISGGSVGGTVNLPAGTELRFTSGTPSLSATISGTGTVIVTGNVNNPVVTINTPVSIPNVTFNGGTITANAATTITNLTMNSQTRINGSGVLTIAQKLAWDAGGFSQMVGTGKTVLAAGATGTILGFSTATIGRVFDNAGNLTFLGSGITFGDSTITPGVLNNLAGATFTASGDGDFSGYVLPMANAINNAGTFIRTGVGTTSLSNSITFNNTGILRVDQGTLDLAGFSNNVAGMQMQFDGANYLSIQAGAALLLTDSSLSSNLTGNTNNADLFQPLGKLVFKGGTAGSPRLLEVMGRDQGNSAAGFNKNFAYGSLQLNSAYVQLVDASDNAAGAGAEALYVDSLVVPAGSTLDLNGLKVYARTTEIAGAVLGGSIVSLPDSGPLVLNLPVSGKIAVASEVDEWTFYGRANDGVTIFANPGDVGSPPPLAPTLGFAKVELVAPNNSVVATASSATAGKTATLLGALLPETGTYRVRIRAADSNPTNTGNYLLSVYEGRVDVAALIPNQNTSGLIDTPYAVDRWTFTAPANRQVRLNVVGSASAALKFKLTGPNGYIGFDQAGSTGIITLTQSGAHTLEVYSSDAGSGAGAGAYSYRLDQLSLTTLTLGVQFAGTLTGPHDAQVFKVPVVEGNPLSVTFDDSTNTDRNEVYIKMGAPPTRQSFDYKYTLTNAADHILQVPFAAPGDWYVLVYGENVPSASSFTIRAAAVPFAVTQISPNVAAANQSAVVTFKGLGFLPGLGLQVELRPVGGGTAIVGQGETVDSIGQATAKFNLTGAAAGQYDVWASLGSYTDTLPSAFTITANGQPHLETKIILPNALGRHVNATLYVEYANTGNVAMPAPILVFRSADPDGSDRPLLTLDQSQVIGGFWNAAPPPGFSDTVQIYASGASPGLLLPGEVVQTPIYYIGLQSPFDFSDDRVEFELRTHDAGSSVPIDWPALQTSLRPAWIDVGAWPAVYANLTAQIGSTWGDYVQMLGDNASFLGQLGGRPTSVQDLFGFEMQQAIGISTVPVIASAVDDAVPTPGLSLSFARTFRNTITERYQVGALGHGWSVPWLTTLQELADGTVVIRQSADVQRIFTTDIRFQGRYFSSPGDSATLKKVGGAFELTSPSGNVTRFKTDGTLDYVKDINGNRVTAGYTGGKLTSLTHTSGATLTLTYNPAGRIASLVDSVGRMTTYLYDATNNYLLSATGPAGTTTYTYSVGNGAVREHALTSTTAPGSIAQVFEYDGRGRLMATFLTGNLQRVEFVYDSAGGVTATDAAGVAVTTSFDVNGQVARIEDGLGNYTRFEYDDAGNVIHQANALGYAQSFTWCNCGEMTSVTNELGNTSAVTLGGPNSRPLSFADANGNLTQYTYDAVGNLTSTINADGSVERATYDVAGEIASLTNRRGQTVTLTRNSAGQVTQEVDAAGAVYSYGYDARGRLQTSVTVQGTTMFTYDTADRMTKVEYPNGRWLQYTYDAAGRRTQLLDHTGYMVNYGYDAVGRISTLRDASNALINSYTYDAASRLLREDQGNGTFVDYVYDALGRVMSIVNHASGGAVNSHFDYTYDVLGRRTSVVTSDGTWSFTYDVTSQLTHAGFASTNMSIPNQDLNYTYDAAGNRLQTVINGVTTNYTVNNLNQYVTAGSTSYSFDLDGNLVSEAKPGSSNAYSYDIHNQLIKVITPSSTWQNEFDGLGNRTASVVNGQRTEFLIDPLGRGNVEATYDGAGTRLASYAHGLRLEGVFASNNWSYFDFDVLGSTAGISNTSGNYVNRYAYEPFGATLLKTEAMANSYEFIGGLGVATDITGLSFMRARTYDATSGRFTAMDPLRLGGGDQNLYGYVLNQPTNWLDPSGTKPAGYNAFLSGLFGEDWCWYGPGGQNVEMNGGPPKFIGLTIGHSEGWSLGVGAGGGLGIVVGADLVAGITPTGVVGGVVGAGGYIGAGPGISWGTFTGISLGVSAGNTYGLGLGWGPCPKEDQPVKPPVPPSKAAGSSQTANPYEQDPNEKFGAVGFGPQHFIAADTGIVYKIKFENLGPGTVPTPTQPATAPAQRVEVTDQLTNSLDWTTLRFTEFGWGDTKVNVPTGSTYYFTSEFMTYNGVTFNIDVEMSFDSETGRVRVVFQSVDHATQLPPDVLTGFLPPEDGTGRGQGYFSYVVQPKATLTTGTEIRNIANIRFGINPVIATNQIDPQNPAAGTDPEKEALNTIDAGAPTSTVAALPPITTTGPFLVSWSGSDEVGGSGVGTFDIYVSDNSGPFMLWLANTPNNSGVYVGQDGHTYGFYSVAIDNVGNRQPSPAVAQATTTLNVLAPTVAQLVVNDGSAQRSRVTSLTVQFNTVVTLPGVPASAFLLSGPSGPIALAVDLSGSTALQTIAKLTFTGSATEFGSLPDGRYNLTVLAAQVPDNYGHFLDGNSNGVGGDNYVLNGTPANGLFRLFGDGNGDGTVNGVDFLAFRLAFLGPSAIFDYDGSGQVVEGTDFLQFRLRFLQVI